MIASVATAGASSPNWRQRNPKLFLTAIITAACLIGLGMTAGLFYFVTGIMRSSDAYLGAMARARSAPTVIAALGTPLEPGYFVMGSIRISGPTGFAELSIPVSGPKGRATIYVEATKHLGEWHFDHLIVQLDTTRERLDLSPAPESAPVAPGAR
ncbi:MAG: cytochrome c oxidase assembly factor Coa1 family protein [Opitutaceae bacterium]